ncbi:hypothetical protein [Burkholderia ubonensis]|uniref:hypothetical protein n=1 Tax=Burkholderia ubonensis TaxID=101571 RepID=UPI000AB87009|nr:hypothetical protein [Burkholderia ubonensis]
MWRSAIALPSDLRRAIAVAERTAKRRAIDIQEGTIIADSVGQAIERFRDEVDREHFRDHSRDGKAVRDSAYDRLTRFFGRMAPQRLETIHGYQFLDARAKFEVKKMREAAQRIANRINRPVKGCMELMLTKHPDYFSMLDIRPAAITTKLDNRSADAYDFAAHANPSTTHRHYDRRKVKAASATE